jgi:hypothetical protein
MSKGSEKRKRNKFFIARVDEAEHAAITAIAENRGLSPGALVRETLLNVPPGRALRRPRADDKLLAQALMMAAKVNAEASKEASLYNQTVRALNAGRPPERLIGMLESGLANLQSIQRDMLEIRGVIMRALGYERERRPTSK